MEIQPTPEHVEADDRRSRVSLRPGRYTYEYSPRHLVGIVCRTSLLRRTLVLITTH